MMKANRVALPNTYHQRAPRGTGWRMMGASIAVMPMRSLTVSHVRRRSRLSMSADGNGIGSNFDQPFAHPDRILRQRMGGRTGGDGAVFVVDAAMAGAHEEARVGEPTHRAPEVRAVH